MSNPDKEIGSSQIRPNTLANGQTVGERLGEKIDEKRAISDAQVQTAQSIARKVQAQATMWQMLSFWAVALTLLFAIPAFVLALRIGELLRGWTP